MLNRAHRWNTLIPFSIELYWVTWVLFSPSDHPFDSIAFISSAREILLFTVHLIDWCERGRKTLHRSCSSMQVHSEKKHSLQSKVPEQADTCEFVIKLQTNAGEKVKKKDIREAYQWSWVAQRSKRMRRRMEKSDSLSTCLSSRQIWLIWKVLLGTPDVWLTNRSLETFSQFVKKTFFSGSSESEKRSPLIAHLCACVCEYSEMVLKKYNITFAHLEVSLWRWLLLPGSRGGGGIKEESKF